MYKVILKPILSKIITIILIILLWPLMLIIALLIKIDSPGRVFFIQKRMGKNGQVFNILKFRSMKENAFYEGSGAYTYENDPRITGIGRFIRKTSLDELPQLFNIVSGKMCFIGPRPLLPDIPLKYEEYPEEYKLRFAILPGMFCLVDARYRAEASFDTQCIMDVEYAKNISFINDIRILIGTAKMVFLRKGIYNEQYQKQDVKEESEV